MDHPIPVRIFGTPTACAAGTSDGWRQATEWVAASLARRFGDQVTVEYVDLFSPDMARFPHVLELIRRDGLPAPLVFVGDGLLSAGERISGPAIRRRLEALGLVAG